jgi:penicillin amidase
MSTRPRKDQSTKALLFRVFVFSWLGAAVSVGCRRDAGSPPPPLVAQLAGTIEAAGLSAPVRVVRDRWGVPHIYAHSQDDLFFAQGFVQAQDRLFQMDLWRRSVQGRLSEILGPNFIERDAMTRRLQYRGDLDAEWNSYGADTRAIATAFVRGVNAWVTLARDRPPEEFVVAGWIPETWSPEDLLNRTDAFLASGDAIDDVRRAGFNDLVADALRRVGTPPFLSGLAAPVRTVRLKTDATDPRLDLSSPRAVSRASVARGGVLAVSEASTRFDAPAPRYFVHLNAPGWNVIGATAPWLPGVAIGHNDRIAWAMTPTKADTQDVYVDAATGSTSGAVKVIKDSIVVKGRKTPFEFDVELTAHGVVIASDRASGRVFTVRWSGMERGAAAELGALAVDRAGAWPEFRTALAAWKMPARRVLFADAAGNVGFQDAALVPMRRGGEWVGWLSLDDLPHALNRRAEIAALDSHGLATSQPPQVLFAHVLGINAPAQQRFSVGPVDRPAGDDSSVRAIFDPGAWDRSRAIVAPGQAGSPDGSHVADLVTMWARGEMFPLAFSDSAVQANMESTLTLISRRP